MRGTSVFLADFGSAAKYVERDGKILPPKLPFRGTVEYCSLSGLVMGGMGWLVGVSAEKGRYQIL